MNWGHQNIGDYHFFVRLPEGTRSLGEDPGQPATFSVSSTAGTQGECFTLTVENGSGMTLDVQYRLENGPVETIRGWPVLDQEGRSQICTDLKTAPGNYTFLSIRNSSNPGWVEIQATITVKPKPSWYRFFLDSASLKSIAGFLNGKCPPVVVSKSCSVR
jgi:hypothetical protein